MKIISTIEEIIGTSVEALFRFRKEFDPIELDWMVRKYVEKEKKKLIDNTYVPNDVQIFISEEDLAEHNPILDQIKNQIRGSLLSMCEEKQYKVAGDVMVRISPKEGFKRGEIKIKTEIVEGEPVELEAIGRIEIIKDGDVKKEVLLKYKSKYLIGRDSECDVVIEDETVSGKHAEIIEKLNEVIISDLKSTNGTMVNDKMIEKVSLKDGDRIQMGHSFLVWRR